MSSCIFSIIIVWHHLQQIKMVSNKRESGVAHENSMRDVLYMSYYF